jgi:hypothetical protein
MARHRHLRSGNNAVQAPPGVSIRPGMLSTAPSGVPDTQDVGKIVYEPTTGVWVANADEWTLVSGAAPTTFVLGPWYVSDVPGTASTEMVLLYTTSSVAMEEGGAGFNDLTMPADGAVLGAFLVVGEARTAGTATLRLRINTVDTAFLAGAVVLDGTNTTRDSVFDETGLAFSAGDEIGLNLTTSGWTPTTAHATAWLLCSFGAAAGSGVAYQPLDASLTSLAALDDPGADKLVFWDDSAGAFAFLEPADNLSITDTDLDATGGGGGTSSLSDILMLGGM